MSQNCYFIRSTTIAGLPSGAVGDVMTRNLLTKHFRNLSHLLTDVHDYYNKLKENDNF